MTPACPTAKPLSLHRQNHAAGDWRDSLPAGKRVSINDGAQRVEPETRTLDDVCIPKTELESRRTKIALTTLRMQRLIKGETTADMAPCRNQKGVLED